MPGVDSTNNNGFRRCVINPGVLYALLAAILFGASTPFAKSLVNTLSPLSLAGLLYLGSGLGLAVIWGIRHFRESGHPAHSARGYLSFADLPWFLGAVIAGGVIGPYLLMLGLSVTPAATASLMLNLESVLTAALAWWVFKENFDRRIFLGMVSIVLASIMLTFQPLNDIGPLWGLAAVGGACLCWAIDNNLTRKVSANDAVQIACIKGVVAGTFNVVLALSVGAAWPATTQALPALGVGFLGYGVSLVCFVLALRHLGTARTSAYFSMAPFVGALLALLLLGEQPGSWFWVAFGFMVVGITLHLTEKHEHLHEHDPLVHTHEHVHDEHHQHNHVFPVDETKPHTHEHLHAPLRHSHPHYPDIHHRHEH